MPEASFQPDGKSFPAASRTPVDCSLTRSGSATDVPRRGRLDLGPELVERRRDALRAGLVAEDEDALEVAEGARRAVAERDRLLDLEALRDPAVAHAAAVLDGHERQEALELAGAADELVAGEGRRAEPEERVLDPGAERGGALRVAGHGGRHELVELAVERAAAAAPCCAR